MAADVVLIEPRSLNANDPEDIPPLPIGLLTTQAIPAKLLQKDVLGWVHMNRAARPQVDFQPPLYLLRIEWGSTRHKEIDLQLGCVMNEIRTAAVADRPAQGRLINVEVFRESRHQRTKMCLVQCGDEVHINSGSRFAGNRTCDRPANRVGDGEGVERPCHEQSNLDGIDRRGHRRSSVSQSG